MWKQTHFLRKDISECFKCSSLGNSPFFPLESSNFKYLQISIDIIISDFLEVNFWNKIKVIMNHKIDDLKYKIINIAAQENIS